MKSSGRINRTAAWVVLAALVSSAWLFAAEEEKADDPWMKLAVARAKAEIAVRDVANRLDQERRGAHNAWQATEQARRRIDHCPGSCRDCARR